MSIMAEIYKRLFVRSVNGNKPDAQGNVSITNVDSANKLSTARKISLTGDATGSATFNGSADASLKVTVADDSHEHTNYIPAESDEHPDFVDTTRYSINGTVNVEAESRITLIGSASKKAGGVTFYDSSNVLYGEYGVTTISTTIDKKVVPKYNVAYIGAYSPGSEDNEGYFRIDQPYPDFVAGNSSRIVSNVNNIIFESDKFTSQFLINQPNPKGALTYSPIIQTTISGIGFSEKNVIDGESYFRNSHMFVYTLSSGTESIGDWRAVFEFSGTVKAAATVEANREVSVICTIPTDAKKPVDAGDFDFYDQNNLFLGSYGIDRIYEGGAYGMALNLQVLAKDRPTGTDATNNANLVIKQFDVGNSGGSKKGEKVLTTNATFDSVSCNAPTADKHIANKKYVDDASAANKKYVDDASAANKKYVDTHLSDSMPDYSVAPIASLAHAFTAPCDGWLFVILYPGDIFRHYYVNGYLVAATGNGHTSNFTNIIPLSKGDVVKTYECGTDYVDSINVFKTKLPDPVPDEIVACSSRYVFYKCKYSK